jgi:hypothetical protein
MAGTYRKKIAGVLGCLPQNPLQVAWWPTVLPMPSQQALHISQSHFSI